MNSNQLQGFSLNPTALRPRTPSSLPKLKKHDGNGCACTMAFNKINNFYILFALSACLEKILCPERFHWQACWFQRAGLPVKTRRPAKFTPSASTSDRGRRHDANETVTVLTYVNSCKLFDTCTLRAICFHPRCRQQGKEKKSHIILFSILGEFVPLQIISI